MRDKITKKRIRVDYGLVIAISGLSSDYMSYLQKNHKFSIRRCGYLFCKKHRIDVDSIYQDCLNNGILTLDDYISECIRLAQDHSWIED